MESYKQPVKGLSRRFIWELSVETLTSRRNENRIFKFSITKKIAVSTYKRSVLRC